MESGKSSFFDRFKGNPWRRYRVGMLVVAALFIWLALFRSGFCFATCTYHSDLQLMQRAVYYNAYEMGLQPDQSSIARFLEEHPSCCSVDRNSHMTRMRYAVVELNYQRTSSRNLRGQEPFYKQFVEISACGTRGEMYGESTSTLEHAEQAR